MADRWTSSILALVALAAVLASSGCGASGLRTQAHAALVTGATLETTGAAIDAARDRSLDAVEEEYGDAPDFEERLDREAARWTPLGASLDACRDALLAWVDAIELARVADLGEDFFFELIVPLVARVVLLYDDIARLSASLGVEVPELPELVRSVATMPGGR